MQLREGSTWKIRSEWEFLSSWTLRELKTWSITQGMSDSTFHARDLFRRCRIVTILTLGLLGCWAKPLDFVEVKRTDEVVTETELEDFLEVVRLLPDGKLPELPTIYRLPLRWSETRTLPVSELINEETSQIERPWDAKHLAHEIETNRRFQRVLRRVEMTPEQFMGLMLTLGTAMNRGLLPDGYDFEGLINRGQKVITQLKRNRTPFNDYSPDRQFSISREAIWLYRLDRAKRLRDVPRENVELVRKHWEELAVIFPKEFQIDPLGTIADHLEEQGIPFEELPETGSDAGLQWNPDEAFIGTDAPRAHSEKPSPL
jgi:hypothetical protein